MNSLIKLNSNGKSLLFPDLPTLFDDFITRDFFNIPTRGIVKSRTIPAVNVKETDLAFELEMAVPGMDKNDFKIGLEHDMLIISAEHQHKTEEDREDGIYFRKEFSYQGFMRQFQLPEKSIKDDEISANYKNGILHILVPKKEPAKPKLLKEIVVA